MMADMRTMASPPIIPPTMTGVFERREGVAGADVGLEVEGTGIGNPIARSGLLKEHEVSIIRKIDAYFAVMVEYDPGGK